MNWREGGRGGGREKERENEQLLDNSPSHRNISFHMAEIAPTFLSGTSINFKWFIFEEEERDYSRASLLKLSFLFLHSNAKEVSVPKINYYGQDLEKTFCWLVVSVIFRGKTIWKLNKWTRLIASDKHSFTHSTDVCWAATPSQACARHLG